MYIYAIVQILGRRNNIQCMYVADDNYITELQSKQNQNQDLYSGSRLANGDRFIPVGMEINSEMNLLYVVRNWK